MGSSCPINIGTNTTGLVSIGGSSGTATINSPLTVNGLTLGSTANITLSSTPPSVLINQVGYAPLTTYTATVVATTATKLATVTLTAGVWFIRGHITSAQLAVSYFVVSISSTVAYNPTCQTTLPQVSAAFTLDAQCSMIVTTTGTATPYYLIGAAGTGQTVSNVFLQATRLA